MSQAQPIQAPLTWSQIIRLGLVQTALGAIVVLTTSTVNRIMVIELALPAMLPARCRLALCAADAAAPLGLRRRPGLAHHAPGSSVAWPCSPLAAASRRCPRR